VLEEIFAPAGPRTQPITFAANAGAPLLLLTGADDISVYPANGTRLAARVRETGGQATTIVYPGIGHIGSSAPFPHRCAFWRPCGRMPAGLWAWSPRRECNGLKYRGKINHGCEDADARVEPGHDDRGVFDAKM
jgi:fermentation-respiration switch protein FrsA (DUF1100 family)